MNVLIGLALLLAAAHSVSATKKRTLGGDLGDHFLPNCINSCVTQFFAEDAGSKSIEMEITYRNYLLTGLDPKKGPVLISDIFVADFVDGKATVAFEADTTQYTLEQGIGRKLVQGMTFKLQLPYACSTQWLEVTGVYVSDDEPGTCGDFKQTCPSNGVTTALTVYMDTWCTCPGVEPTKLQTVVSAFESCA